jgi:two-component system, OmpR family, response regulator
VENQIMSDVAGSTGEIRIDNERSSSVLDGNYSNVSVSAGPDRPPRILIVDDDDVIRQYLDEHNIRTIFAGGRQAVVRQLAAEEPSLVILGLGPGRHDGLDVLREIRARSDVPVIITTEHGHGEIDRVVGLELGADDYVTKPYNLRELLARIRALLRRSQARCAVAQRAKERGSYQFGPWRLDRRTRTLTGLDGIPVPLTKGEYTLLVAFLEAPQRPLSREQLLQQTRMHEDVFDRSIDVQVMRLRRKLEIDPGAPRVIRTERGVGYVFNLPVELV